MLYDDLICLVKYKKQRIYLSLYKIDDDLVLFWKKGGLTLLTPPVWMRKERWNSEIRSLLPLCGGATPPDHPGDWRRILELFPGGVMPRWCTLFRIQPKINAGVKSLQKMRRACSTSGTNSSLGFRGETNGRKGQKGLKFQKPRDPETLNPKLW